MFYFHIHNVKYRYRAKIRNLKFKIFAQFVKSKLINRNCVNKNYYYYLI